MSIGERLKQWRAYKNLKQDDISALLGIPFSTYQKYEMGNRKPGADAMEVFSRAGINANWLLTGSGEMLLKPHQPYMGIEANRESGPNSYKEYPKVEMGPKVKPIIMLLQDFVTIPRHGIELLEEKISLSNELLQVGQVAFRKDWISKRKLLSEDCVLIKAKGDSMEPTICNGDLLLADRRINFIKDDAIYVVCVDNSLVVRRIQKGIDGSLTIISDNKKYKEQIISSEQVGKIKIAGRVIWYSHEI
ncbi:LexA family transcriptional regulator [Methylobacter sp. S3L5C]|uniref:XRE family transcriptional regulator n=1 Tax=Methylobacter sp. S3L5C TaxID=2839024 RepID=UPI001FAE16DD|nr:LexA family transcriptional regulator [Methylobacter sp. S3L5C]UOA07815.1 helix-turn-helix domain-containing protein [Methylobacter sp. S3L5C]